MGGISIEEKGAVAQKPATSEEEFRERFREVRGTTEALSAPLSPEDRMVQSCAEASPVKWHLAHTSWFFETFALREFLPGYREFHPDFGWLFNSYYNSLGDHPEKRLRSSFARPDSGEIHAYREHVEAGVERLLDGCSSLGEEARREALGRIEMGLHHEQQHQELIATDIKHALWTNPLRTPYAAAMPQKSGGRQKQEMGWIGHPGGLVDIGHGGACFAFDNESPRHTVFLRPFEIASRPATCGEYLEFMRDGGYGRPELWLSDGWDAVRAAGWQAPLYWEQPRRRGASAASGGERWEIYTLRGVRTAEEMEHTPVCHVSYFEADAFARWYGLHRAGSNGAGHAGVRLATEAEWEEAAAALPVEGNLLESGALHPMAAGATDEDGAGAENASPDGQPGQMFGDVWEWTQSAYLAYPGYEAPSGDLGEYNGKFMSGSMVLRGGSCATPATHIRASYRNFFHPATRWQFSGIRLARLTPSTETRR
ncbi:MAG: ergothioneine biosynthesis protein EgtB [Acidobacteriaceae bacterium]